MREDAFEPALRCSFGRALEGEAPAPEHPLREHPAMKHDSTSWSARAASAAALLTLIPALANQAQAQATGLVSQPQGYNSASWTSLSGDGRWCAYVGYMPDPLVDNSIHVFVRDRQNGVTFDLTPLPPAGGSPQGPSISSDGQWVAYTRGFTIVHNATNYLGPHVLKQAATGGPTQVVSLGLGGAPANKPCGELAVSMDGRFIVFESTATNLVGELKANQPGDEDIFVRDTLSGATFLVSVSAAGGSTSNNYSQSPAISRDGRFVAFESTSTDLVAGGTNGTTHIFVRDLQTAVTVLISAPNGVQGTHHSHEPALSADGRYVVYESLATNLVPGDTNNATDVFVCDRDPDGDQIFDEGNSITTRASVGPGGLQGNGPSDNGVISGDGRRVAFRSFANILVPGDLNNKRDVFSHDRWAEATSLASVDSNGVQGNGDSGLTSKHALGISTDGRVCVFLSDATYLVPGDGNGKTDVFSRELGLAPPVSYCTAKLNSQGCTPFIGFSGTQPSLSAPGPFLILAGNVISNKIGIMIYGYGPNSLPFQGGTLCIAPPTVRTSGQASGGNPPPDDCSGTFSLDFNAYLQSGVNPALVAYRLVFAQYWYRDPAAAFSSGLTDALQMSIAP